MVDKIKGLGISLLRNTYAEDIRRLTIETAFEVKDEEERRGFPKDAIISVDGTPFRREQTVKPFGKIRYLARSDIVVIADWFFKKLQTKSPRDSGRFLRSHTFWYDDKPVNPTALTQENDSPKKITILNKQPYAARLERGASLKFPDGIYQPLVKSARRKFGSRSSRASGKATISFSWVRSNAFKDTYLRPLITIRRR